MVSPLKLSLFHDCLVCATTSVSGMPFDTENSPKTARMKVIELLVVVGFLGSLAVF